MVLSLQNIKLEELIHRIRFSWNKPSEQEYDEIRIYHTIYDGYDFNEYISISPNLTVIDIGIIGYSDPEPLDGIPLYNDSILDGVKYNFNIVGVYQNIESLGSIVSGTAVTGYRLYLTHDNLTNVIEFNDIDQLPDIIGNNFTISGLVLGDLYDIKVVSYIVQFDGSIIESNIEPDNIKHLLAYPLPVISKIVQQNNYNYIYFPEVIADGEEIYTFYIKDNLNNSFININVDISHISLNPSIFRAKVSLQNNPQIIKGVEYNYLFNASSSYGVSDKSVEVSGIITDGFVPYPLQSINIINTTFNTISINLVDNKEQLDDIMGYRIYVLHNTNQVKEISLDITDISYTISGLSPKLLYTIEVKAYNSYGFSESIQTQIKTLIEPINFSFVSGIQRYTINISRELTHDEYLIVQSTISGDITYGPVNLINRINYNDSKQIIGLYGGYYYNVNIKVISTFDDEIKLQYHNIVYSNESQINVLNTNILKINKTTLELQWL